MVLHGRVGASSRALHEDGAPREETGQMQLGQSRVTSRVSSVSEVRPQSPGRHLQRCQLQLLGCSACKYAKFPQSRRRQARKASHEAESRTGPPRSTEEDE